MHITDGHIKQFQLALSLYPISLRELLGLKEAPADIYSIGSEDLFLKIIEKDFPISIDVIKRLVNQGFSKLYVDVDKKEEFITHFQNQLRQCTRGLSIGNTLENGKKIAQLLTINMQYLYEDPTRDDLLTLQFQSAKNFATFLQNNYQLIPLILKDFTKQKFHYIMAQPLISSLLLIGLLKTSGLYSEREIEQLFLTSYFKDIGMSSIPTEKYSSEILSEQDIKILASHPEESVLILGGRVPLNTSYLKIIEHHHTYSILKGQELLETTSQQKQVIAGFETMIISIMDVIAAMISERPYRKAISIYQSLEFVKLLIQDQFPREFKLLVNYFKSFLQNWQQ